MDLNLCTTVGKLLAQPVHVNLHRVRGNVPGRPEDVIFDQLLGNHAVLPAQEQFEYCGLARRQDLWLVVDEGLAAFSVKREIADLQRTSEQLTGPSQQGFE